VLDINEEDLYATAQVFCQRCQEPIRNINDPVESIFTTCGLAEGHFHVTCVGAGRKRKHFTRDIELK
jgi:predicted amidophosphoribosyltransferase